MSKVTLGQNPSSKPARLPNDNYKLRITEEPTFKVSQKGNGYLLFKFEIAEPTEKIVDGAPLATGGMELQCICVLPPSNAFMLEALHKGLGLPLDFEVDDNGVPVGFTYAGREVWAQCYGEEIQQKNAAGEVMVNPVTGAPLVFSRPVVKQFYF